MNSKLKTVVETVTRWDLWTEYCDNNNISSYIPFKAHLMRDFETFIKAQDLLETGKDTWQRYSAVFEKEE